MDRAYSFGQRILLLLAAAFGPILLLLYGASWKVRWAGEEHLERARAASGRVLYAFWHSRLLGLCYTHRNRNAAIMVSRSFDGEWISRIITRLGYRVFRGSASEGGAVALLDMIKDDASGDLALTVDGPRGPVEKVKPGAVALASESGLPIVPITVKCDRAWLLKTWDRFIVPKPFSAVTVEMGRHISVPPAVDKGDLQSYSDRLREELNGLG